MSKRPSILGDLSAKVSQPVPTADGGEISSHNLPGKGEASIVKTSTYFSRAVHEKLREIAFTERKSINDLIIEGLDRMLEQRSYPTTKELTERAKIAS